MKMETSKKLLWLNHVIFYVLITLVIICTFAGIECSNLTTVTSCVAVEVGAATSFYYSMNKKLNLPKIIKHIYDDAPRQMDINQILSNISN